MKDFMSVVIPAYNEEQNIKRIQDELMPVMKSMPLTYEIIVVDDGSTDNTYNEALKISKTNKKVRIVRHKRNMGLAAATRTGIKSSRGNISVFLDSDFTFHPSEMPKLYKKYKETGCDCVVGSHFGPSGDPDLLFHRLVLSKGVNKLYSTFLGKKISTISSIFRLYKTAEIKKLKLNSKGFDICAEILVRMIQNKCHIEEVPVRLTTRIYGESKLNNRKEFVNHIKMLSKVASWKIKGKQ
ncbi:MAG TPA: glycosyltransferase family 2 protein [archaeon]|nr:glycosyltransferase family 2 protein [archaeon]